MKLRNILYGATLVIVTAITTSTVVSQDKTKTTPPKAGGDQGMPNLPPDVQEMMQKCQVAGTPGENHKTLNTKVGKWTGAGKFWMSPDMPTPEQSTCTSEVKWILGNRFLSENIEGSMGEETFLGQSWAGYDNVLKKYTWVWIDNMSTGIMSAQGTYDTATKTYKYTTTAACPVTEKVVNGRSTEKWIDNDHFVMEMYGPWPKTGKEFKTMEITFTRVK